MTGPESGFLSSDLLEVLQMGTKPSESEEVTFSSVEIRPRWSEDAIRDETLRIPKQTPSSPHIKILSLKSTNRIRDHAGTAWSGLRGHCVQDLSTDQGPDYVENPDPVLTLGQFGFKGHEPCRWSRPSAGLSEYFHLCLLFFCIYFWNQLSGHHIFCHADAPKLKGQKGFIDNLKKKNIPFAWKSQWQKQVLPNPLVKMSNIIW